MMLAARVDEWGGGLLHVENIRWQQGEWPPSLMLVECCGCRCQTGVGGQRGGAVRPRCLNGEQMGQTATPRSVCCVTHTQQVAWYLQVHPDFVFWGGGGELLHIDMLAHNKSGIAYQDRN
jgi:hypothetical protein